ncbi:MAG: hypothetical protein IJT62_06375 [Oscillospiraceae bacterium]|nr:hypothetical protein [Oscillospiraceae bacterium]
MKNWQKKVSLVLCLVLVVAVALSACGGSSSSGSSANSGSSSSSANSGSAAAAEPVKKDTLTIAIPGNPTTIDPHGKNDATSMAVRRQIYEGLTLINPNMEIEPCLAESWEISEDGSSYTFHIRQGVKFSDGNEMKASDVAYSLQRAYDGNYATVFMAAFDLENSKVIDDYTYELALKYPSGTVLQTLAYPSVGITEESVVTGLADDQISTQCPGTGPYKFSAWADGDSVTLVKNENYWGECAGCDTMVLRIIPETSSRVVEVETGSVDIAYDVSITDINRYVDDPNVNTYRTTTTFLTYIGMNCTKAPFDNPLVRQAVGHCVNREDFVAMVWGGQGTPATSIVSDSLYGYSPDVELLDYNPETSKALLAEAGYPDGLDTYIWVRDQQLFMDAGEALANQLRAGGFNAQVKVVEWASLLVDLENKQLDIYIMNLGVPTGDAGDGLFRYFSSTSPFSSNTAFYSNPEFDALLEKANRETDPAKRLELLKECQQFAINDAPWVPLLNNESLFLSTAKVQGLDLHPSTYQYFKDTYVLK